MVTVSVIHCFDHNYALPAAVAFRSLLEHANTPGVVYDLHVLGTGITDADRVLLEKVVAPFPQARLTFREPPPNPVPPKAIRRKGHYSADLYYKLMVPDIYPELDRAILADVDVIWGDDVAKVWNYQPSTSNLQPSTLVFGAWDPGYAAYHREGLYPTGRPLIRKYARKFTPDELEKLRISAGLMVFDLAGLRREGIVRKWIDFAIANAHRAILPEQEPINIVTHDRIATLPHNFMADAASFGHERWHEVFDPPVMLHFASSEKPWKFPGAPLAPRWFEACSRAGLMTDCRRTYGGAMARRRYDVAVSIGGACSTTEAMRAAKLQWATLPLDWTGGPTFREKVDLIASDFARWMTKSGMHPLPAAKFSREIFMKDDVLGFTFNHDFSFGVPFDEDYERVKAKFDRRIRRMYELFAGAKRILFVWIGVPVSTDVPMEDFAHAREVFGRKWPDKTVDFLYSEHTDGVPFDQRTERAEGGVRHVAFDYRKREKDNEEWLADVELLTKWLASEYEVPDYRTDAEREAWKRQRRKTRYRRYHADNLFDYVRTMVEYKLYRHLGKQLSRKGIA